MDIYAHLCTVVVRSIAHRCDSMCDRIRAIDEELINTEVVALWEDAISRREEKESNLEEQICLEKKVYFRGKSAYSLPLCTNTIFD